MIEGKSISYWMENFDLVAVIQGFNIHAVYHLRANWIGGIVMLIYKDMYVKDLLRQNIFFETGWLPTKDGHKRTEWDFAVTPIFDRQTLENLLVKLNIDDKVEILTLRTSLKEDGQMLVEVILPSKV